MSAKTCASEGGRKEETPPSQKRGTAKEGGSAGPLKLGSGEENPQN